MEPPKLHHEEKLSKCFLDVVFPIPIDTLFSLVWLTDSPFWKKFMLLRKTKNWYAEDWSEKDGEYQRECRCLQVTFNSPGFLLLEILACSTADRCERRPPS